MGGGSKQWPVNSGQKDGERGSKAAKSRWRGEQFRSGLRSLFGDHETIVRQTGGMIGKLGENYISRGINKLLESGRDDDLDRGQREAGFLLARSAFIGTESAT